MLSNILSVASDQHGGRGALLAKLITVETDQTKENRVDFSLSVGGLLL